MYENHRTIWKGYLSIILLIFKIILKIVWKNWWLCTNLAQPSVFQKVSIFLTIKFAIFLHNNHTSIVKDQDVFFLSSDFILSLPKPVRNIPKTSPASLPIPVRNIPKTSPDVGATKNSVWARLGPMIEKNLGNWTFDTDQVKIQACHDQLIYSIDMIAT